MTVSGDLFLEMLGQEPEESERSNLCIFSTITLGVILLGEPFERP